MTAESATPLLVSIRDAGRILGVSRTVVYELMGAGRLASVHIGARRLIRYADLQAIADGGAAVPTEAPELGAKAPATILNVPAPASRRARRPIRRTDGGRRRAA
jgi:excisionase family DNA binding protein